MAGAYEVTITIRSRDFAYILRALDEINRQVFEHGPTTELRSDTGEGSFTLTACATEPSPR
jgi:hypothetical protein